MLMLTAWHRLLGNLAIWVKLNSNLTNLAQIKALPGKGKIKLDRKLVLGE